MISISEKYLAAGSQSAGIPDATEVSTLMQLEAETTMANSVALGVNFKL